MAQVDKELVHYVLQVQFALAALPYLSQVRQEVGVVLEAHLDQVQVVPAAQLDVVENLGP